LPRHKLYFSGKESKDPELKKLIREVVSAALKAEGINFPCEINILLTDDGEIRTLNRDFRNKDVPTDVLSFPMLELIPGEPIDPDDYMDPETATVPLGDMAISVERAKAQSEEYGHSAEREVVHLLGYDHIQEGEDRRQMRAREEGIMESCGLKR